MTDQRVEFICHLEENVSRYFFLVMMSSEIKDVIFLMLNSMPHLQIYISCNVFCCIFICFVLIDMLCNFHGVAGTKVALVIRGLNYSILVMIRCLRTTFKWHQVKLIIIILLYNKSATERYTFSSKYLGNFAEMSNQQLIDAGRKQMDQTDQAIQRSKMVCCWLTHSIFFSSLSQQFFQESFLAGCCTNCWSRSSNCCFSNTASKFSDGAVSFSHECQKN